MILWREARVASLVREWDGAVEYEVEVVVEGADPRLRRCRALAYPRLVGKPDVGELVLLNTTALERGLGTGGYALIVALPQRIPSDAPMGPGHLVKARYTPLQAMVLGVDEQESEHHALLAEADDLLGMPVIVADLHSSLPAILAGLRHPNPICRVGYVMTDGGALPAWFSRSIAALREAGWIDLCITAGQAFGGDLEAVSVHSALLAAKLVAGVDVVVVAQGPGNLGTGTRWGFSGVQAGEVLNAAAVLNGRGVAALRISGADARERHQGVSHHSLTAYGRVALAPADVVVPVLDTEEPLAGGLADLGRLVDRQVAQLVTPAGRHREIRVPVDGLLEALRATPIGLSTMGRGLDDDPAAFLAAAAAGRHVRSLLAPPLPH
ncbi:MAG TPA: DUF3866 family protein [Kineosporiaceae bacterium]|nr:DUF3866 family protein [Kineosporiaceae bacterium]